MGLTELKAQASWIDTRTVRAHRSACIRLLHPISTYVNVEDREEVRIAVLQTPSPQLNLVLRSGAVVVYDDPLERTVGNAGK